MRRTRTRPRRSDTRWVPFLLLPLALVGCSGGHRGGAPPVPVVTARAEARDLPLLLPAVGTVEPIEAAAVKAQVGGLIAEVRFAEGQEVAEGQPLFQVDPRPFRAALGQAEADLRRGRAQQENAARQAGRYEELVAKDFVTREQYDSVRTQAESLRAQVASDEEAVVRARLDLDYATVRAPISGRAGAILVKKGNVVKANEAVLVTVNQIRPIRVAFAIPGESLADVRRCAAAGPLTVRARPSGGGAELGEGRLTFVDNQVDSATGTVTLKAQFDNADGALWPGQFVEVELVLEIQKGAVVVPDAAVVEGQKGAFVWVVEGGAAVRREVTVRRSAGGWSLAEPMREGEVVVTDGQSRLAHGPKGEPPKVEVRSGGAPGAPAP